MYRPSNERYSESGNPKPHNTYPYPPAEHSLPKMHSDGYQSAMPPLYDYMQNNSAFDYLPPSSAPGISDNFDRSYPPPTWRDPADSSKPPINQMSIASPALGNSGSHFDSRGIQNHNDYPGGKPVQEPYISGGPPPQMNVVQRISGLIKSQLNVLQSILIYAEKKSSQERQKKERSRSRSRQKADKRKEHREWNCPRCNFLNFDFRDQCKKCSERKPVEKEGRSVGSIHSHSKSYVPGPDDWRCSKCSNINYARRTQCHRCHTPRNR